jgi:hypothetical protein
VVPHIYAPSVDDSLDTDSAINSNFLLNSRSGGTWVLEFGPPCVNSQKTIHSQWGVIVFPFFGRGRAHTSAGRAILFLHIIFIQITWASK